MKKFKIGSRHIGNGEPVFFLAEIGLNHNGDMNLAESMIRAASRTGAEGVKFQTYQAETLADPSKKPELFQIFKRSELGKDEHMHLKKTCDELDMYFISTPFDEASVELLMECDVPAFKIASGDLTNMPLLEKVASCEKPIIISTGMGYMDEVLSAIKILETSGASEILPLHCVSSYPPDDIEINLNTIPTMTRTLKRPVGYSDHYVGALAILGAVALGAVFIEKHFTTDKNLPGPDQRLSSDEGELRTIIGQTRALERMLGDGEKRPSVKETEIRNQGRKGIYAMVDIPKGVKIDMYHLKFNRPEGELPASRVFDVIGKYSKCAIPAGSPISEKHLETAPVKVK